jgi:transcriptional regulator with XRE-family HTH domain
VTARTRKDHHAFRIALGRTIRALRLARDISQERLADLADMDRSYTGGIERGERRPTMEKVYELVVAMGVSLGDFIVELDRQLAAASDQGRRRRQ